MSEIDQAIAKFAESLENLISTRADSVAEARNLQAASRIAQQIELQRLSRRYGPDHPRTLSMKTRLASSGESLRTLQLMTEITATKVERPAAEELLIEGRVSDKKARGLPGLLVALADAKAQRIRLVEPVSTKTGGYFALRITAQLAARLRESHPDGVFPMILTEKGKTIHVADKPVLLEPDRQRPIEIVLDRADFPPERTGGSPTAAARQSRKSGVAATRKKQKPK